MNTPQSGDLHYIGISLPPEIVDQIFRYACIFSRGFCVSLSLTSTWTRKLALPYLFSTLVIKRLRVMMPLREVLVKTPISCPISDFYPATHVKGLWIQCVANFTLEIFQHCNFIRHLALNDDNLFWIIHSSTPSAARLSFLPDQAIRVKPDIHLLIINAHINTWSLGMLSEPQPSPFFEKVTHLRIGQIGPYSTHLHLAHFTRLSHIAVPFHLPQAGHFLDDLLPLLDMPSVMMVVVVILTDKVSESDTRDALQWVLEARKRNRPVCAVVSQSTNLQAEWEEEARVGINIWDSAVQFTESLSL